jgi:hypothetical protein
VPETFQQFSLLLAETQRLRSWRSSLLGDPGSKFLCEELRKAGRKKKEQRKARDGIQTAELDRRDQVTATSLDYSLISVAKKERML